MPDRYAERVEQAKNWPTFRYGSLTPVQREVVSWLAFGTWKPKIKGSTLRSLLRREVVKYEGGKLVLTEIGQQYAKTMRS